MIQTPDDRFRGLPGYDYGQHHFDWDGLRLHFVDEGDGPPVVLFHGEPTWSFLYRGVIGRLAEAGHRAIAPDMPGFGKSDKPTDPDFYTYDRLTEAMSAVVEHLQLEDATAVVHDWGGPIGLRVAVEHVDAFRRLVILNTGLYRRPGPVPPALAAWREFVERTPDLPIGVIVNNGSTRDLGAEVRAGYDAPFPTQEHKVGACRLPLIVPLTDQDPGAAEMKAVHDQLTRWDRPVLVLFSDQDPIFPLRAGERLAAAIPGAGPLEVVTGAGHFLQEDDAAGVAAAIIDFLDRT